MWQKGFELQDSFWLMRISIFFHPSPFFQIAVVFGVRQSAHSVCFFFPVSISTIYLSIQQHMFCLQQWDILLHCILFILVNPPFSEGPCPIALIATLKYMLRLLFKHNGEADHKIFMFLCVGLHFISRYEHTIPSSILTEGVWMQQEK